MENGDKIRVHEDIAILKTQMFSVMASIKSLSTKFWAVILLLLANLTGLVVNFYK